MMYPLFLSALERSIQRLMVAIGVTLGKLQNLKLTEHIEKLISIALLESSLPSLKMLEKQQKA